MTLNFSKINWRRFVRDWFVTMVAFVAGQLWALYFYCGK